MAAILDSAAQDATDSLTLGELFETWLRDGVARNNANAELRRSFNKDVLPSLGTKPLRDVTEHDLRAILRRVVARNAPRRAVSVYADINQMLSWGEKRKPWRALLIDGNPAHLVDIDQLLPDDYEEERSRVLSTEELRELKQICIRMDQTYADLPPGQKYSGIRPLKKETDCPCGSAWERCVASVSCWPPNGATWIWTTASGSSRPRTSKASVGRSRITTSSSPRSPVIILKCSTP